MIDQLLVKKRSIRYSKEIGVGKISIINSQYLMSKSISKTSDDEFDSSNEFLSNKNALSFLIVMKTE